MRPEILIMSMYPAPYRVELFDRLSRSFACEVFFESRGGDERDEKWFLEGSYHTLDTPEGMKRWKSLRLRDFRLVLVFEYSTREGVRLVMRCKRERVPYVINCDGMILGLKVNPLKELLKKYLIRGAAGWFAGGEYARKYLVRYGADPDGITVHTFSELEDGDIADAPPSPVEKRLLRERLGLPRDGRLVLGAGRFIPLKRYGELIEAWKVMPRDCRLLLIGGGSERGEYERIIARLALENVILRDFTPKDELDGYYRAADVFIHPTSYDSWGLVINEAMAHGLPVVSSDRCVAALELVENGVNGYCVPMGDDGLLCRRTAEILGDGEKYRKMAENALERIRPYTMSSMAQTQTEAIKRLLARSPGR